MPSPTWGCHGHHKASVKRKPEPFKLGKQSDLIFQKMRFFLKKTRINGTQKTEDFITRRKKNRKAVNKIKCCATQKKKLDAFPPTHTLKKLFNLYNKFGGGWSHSHRKLQTKYLKNSPHIQHKSSDVDIVPSTWMQQLLPSDQWQVCNTSSKNFQTTGDTSQYTPASHPIAVPPGLGSRPLQPPNSSGTMLAQSEARTPLPSSWSVGDPRQRY